MYAWQWATIATLYREAGGGEPPFVLVEHVFCLPSGLSERSSARPEAVVTSVTARPERFFARQDKGLKAPSSLPEAAMMSIDQ